MHSFGIKYIKWYFIKLHPVSVLFQTNTFYIKLDFQEKIYGDRISK